jgi:hypothetical protein
MCNCFTTQEAKVSDDCQHDIFAHPPREVLIALCKVLHAEKISKQVDERCTRKMHLALRAVQFNFPNEEGSPGLHQCVHVMQRASLASVKLLLRSVRELSSNWKRLGLMGGKTEFILHNGVLKAQPSKLAGVIFMLVFPLASRESAGEEMSSLVLY